MFSTTTHTHTHSLVVIGFLGISLINQFLGISGYLSMFILGVSTKSCQARCKREQYQHHSSIYKTDNTRIPDYSWHFSQKHLFTYTWQVKAKDFPS
jgi:hypothetical protein